MMKRCSKCGELMELSEFNKQKSAKGGYHPYCRECSKTACTKYNHDVKGHISMSKNKECPSYLGIAVAERLVKYLFKDVITMPNNNPGYDFICAKDKKIDVKSACITLNNEINPRWVFHIDKNQITNYFLLLAFDNRDDLEPQHQWLIPSDVLNHLKSIATISPSTISKWDEYRQPINQVQACCSTLKEMTS